MNVSTRSSSVTAGGRVRGCTALVGIVSHYALLCIIGGNGGLFVREVWVPFL